MSVAEERPRGLGEHCIRLRGLNTVRVHERQRRERRTGEVDWIEPCLVVEIEHPSDPREAAAGLGHEL
jgi:hypothetical protein